MPAESKTFTYPVVCGLTWVKIEILQYFRMSQKRETPPDSMRANPQNKRSKIAGTWPSFQNLPNNPDDYFGDAMMMVGLGRLEDLRRCRQVCQSWNEMIAQMREARESSRSKPGV